MKRKLFLKIINLVLLVIILSNFIVTNFVYAENVNVEDYMNDLHDDNFKDVGSDEAQDAIGGMDNDQFSRTNKRHYL